MAGLFFCIACIYRLERSQPRAARRPLHRFAGRGVQMSDAVELGCLLSLGGRGDAPKAKGAEK
jgi:hypothetical protein